MRTQQREFAFENYDLWKTTFPVIARERRPEPLFSIGDDVEIRHSFTGPIVEREYDPVYGYTYCVLLVDPSDDGNDEREWCSEKNLTSA